MREIKNIVLHCTGTQQNVRVQAILDYWRNQLKWNNPGYNYLIEANGRVHILQPIELIANGVAGHNANSIHVAYVGGVDANNAPIDNRTLAQKAEMKRIVNELKTKFPKAQIVGHRDFAGVKKACPCFDVKQWLTQNGLL